MLKFDLLTKLQILEIRGDYGISDADWKILVNGIRNAISTPFRKLVIKVGTI